MIITKDNFANQPRRGDTFESHSNHTIQTNIFLHVGFQTFLIILNILPKMFFSYDAPPGSKYNYTLCRCVNENKKMHHTLAAMQIFLLQTCGR
jgi:hypothetical protein